jgi:hypothetical protein
MRFKNAEHGPSRAVLARRERLPRNESSANCALSRGCSDSFTRVVRGDIALLARRDVCAQCAANVDVRTIRGRVSAFLDASFNSTLALFQLTTTETFL